MTNFKVISDEYTQGLPAESLSSYGEGGLCPIYINDELQNGRYKILNKLCCGSFGTVWAAQDFHMNTKVSIKVIKAKFSDENNQELLSLQRIQNAETQHPGHKYLPKLLDHFYHTMFGRRNLCLVLELLGPRLDNARSLQPGFRYSIPSARHISKQLLLAVDCLHTLGIVHGDIHDYNVLFRLPDNYDLKIDEPVTKGLVKRKDKTPLSKEIPEYLVDSFNMIAGLKRDKKQLGDIQLIDFSSSFFESKPPESLVSFETPPELLFRKPLSRSVDIWSLALTIFFVTTSRRLFEGVRLSDKRTMIPPMVGATGEASAYWILTSLCEVIHKGKWKDLPPLKFPFPYGAYALEEAIPLNYYGEYGFELTEDLKVLRNFLQKALVADPSKRATAKELRDEEWVQTVELD